VLGGIAGSSCIRGSHIESPGPPGRGLGVGLTAPPCKNPVVWKSKEGYMAHNGVSCQWWWWWWWWLSWQYWYFTFIPTFSKWIPVAFNYRTQKGRGHRPHSRRPTRGTKGSRILDSCRRAGLCWTKSLIPPRTDASQWTGSTYHHVRLEVLTAGKMSAVVLWDL